MQNVVATLSKKKQKIFWTFARKDSYFESLCQTVDYEQKVELGIAKLRVLSLTSKCKRMKAGQCRIICLVQSGARMSIAIVLKGQKIKQILNFVLMDEMVFCYQNCSDLQCEKVVW